MANMQPRPRTAATKPDKPRLPVRVEHEYDRQGALNLFAAFDTRTGEVWGQTYERKRLRIADFADKQVLAERLKAFIGEWNAIAHPFNWSSKSVAKVMAKCKPTQPDLAIAA